MRLYLDENLPPRLAEMLRPRGVDAVSAHEVGNTQLDDHAQLRYATQQDRAIVTANVADFVELAAQWLGSNTEHAGIVLVPSTFRTNEFAAIAEAVDRLVGQHAAGLRGAVVYLSRS